MDATKAHRVVRAAIVRLIAKHPAAVARLVNRLVLQYEVLRVHTPALAAQMTGLQCCGLGIRCILLRVVTVARHDTMCEVLDTARLDLAVASSIGLECQLDAAVRLMHSTGLALDLPDKALEDRSAHVVAGVEVDAFVRHVMWSRAKKIMKKKRQSYCELYMRYLAYGEVSVTKQTISWKCSILCITHTHIAYSFSELLSSILYLWLLKI